MLWWRTCFLVVAVCSAGMSQECLKDPAQAYRFTGTACRLTYPAAVVLNEKTSKVIEAAFQHAKYPSMRGEKALLFGSKLLYGLDNLEIFNLTIGQSAFELRPGEAISLDISDVSAVFRGTIQYSYDSWLVGFGNSVDFEIESQIDLGIKPKLYCGNGKVAADTSDCYLKFHKLNLLLQGDREPNWLKRLFTNFITFTVKVVIRGQICQEINKVANILADFIQETAGQKGQLLGCSLDSVEEVIERRVLAYTSIIDTSHPLHQTVEELSSSFSGHLRHPQYKKEHYQNFLSDGNISVDIGVTGSPVITANYVESYHKGFTKYNNTTAVIDDSNFNPAHLTEHKMLYFWLSDKVLNSILNAANQDGRFQLNISGTELTDLFNTNSSDATPEFIQKCFMEPGAAELRVWSSSVPFLNTSRDFGTTVWTKAAGQLYCGGSATPLLAFDTDVAVEVWVSYANKKVSLPSKITEVWAGITGGDMANNIRTSEDYTKIQKVVESVVEKIGVPKIIAILETEVTRLLDKQGVYLFDIYNPEVIPKDNYLIIQMDFGFPHHLLVEFLRKTLE